MLWRTLRTGAAANRKDPDGTSARDAAARRASDSTSRRRVRTREKREEHASPPGSPWLSFFKFFSLSGGAFFSSFPLTPQPRTFGKPPLSKTLSRCPCDGATEKKKDYPGIDRTIRVCVYAFPALHAHNIPLNTSAQPVLLRTRDNWVCIHTQTRTHRSCRIHLRSFALLLFPHIGFFAFFLPLSLTDVKLFPHPISISRPPCVLRLSSLSLFLYAFFACFPSLGVCARMHYPFGCVCVTATTDE